MITLKDFKTAHNLSDSGFKRLSARVLSARPYLILTARIAGSSTGWEVLEPDTMTRALTDYETFPNIKTKSQQKAETQPDQSSALAKVEVMPEPHQSALAQLTDRFSTVTPYRRSETALNGSQAEAVSAIELIANRIDLMDQRNAEKRSKLEQRKQDLSKLEALVSQLVEIGHSKDLEGRDLDNDSQQMKRDEEQLKKQINALSSSLF